MTEGERINLGYARNPQISRKKLATLNKMGRGYEQIIVRRIPPSQVINTSGGASCH